MIRWAVCQWVLDRTGIDAVYRAAHLGFTAIQIEIRRDDDIAFLADPRVQRGYLHAARETGVAIIGLALNITMRHSVTAPPDAPSRQLGWRAIQVGIDAAAAMQIPMVYMPSFYESRVKDDQSRAATVDVLRAACEYVGEREVFFTTENTLDSAGSLDLIHRVNHPGLRVLVDAYNPTVWGHHASDLFLNLAPYLVPQFHAKDGTDRKMGNAAIGQGDADFARSVAALHQIGFDGYAIAENQYGEDAEARVAADVAAMRRFFGDQFSAAT